MTPVMTKELHLDGRLTPRDAEVVAAEVQAGMREGVGHFRFSIERGFLPSLGWLERLGGVLRPLVENKLPIELLCESGQVESIRRAGIHLIADISAENG